MSNSKPSNPSKPIVTILGDSTIDNKLWISPGIYGNYIFDRLGIKRDNTAKRLKKADRLFFKPELSVVENLIKMLPTHQIFDYSNDGFTTTDYLNGQYKDKVFGVGTFKLFPHEKFNPLKASEEDIKKSNDIILSIGGNNFREFLVEARTIKNKQKRQEYIRNNFHRVFKTMQDEYITIVKKLRELNHDAKIILMTQYYPSAIQNNYKIYPLMKELGSALNIGVKPDNPMDVIHELMKRIYQQILKHIPQENIVVVDVTSSLDPYTKHNFVNQIEPSGVGGNKIAQMLKYVLNDDKHINSGIALQFQPKFFTAQHKNDFVEKIPFNDWVPKHPYTFIHKTTNQQKLMIKEMLNEIQALSTKFKSDHPMYKACANVYKDADKLLSKISTKEGLEDLETSLSLVRASLKNPDEERPILALEFYALRGVHGHPNSWKKFSGSLMTFAGASSIIYGLHTPLSGDAKLGAAVGGSLLLCGGATLFYNGRRKSVSKSMSALAAMLYDKQLRKILDQLPHRQPKA